MSVLKKQIVLVLTLVLTFTGSARAQMLALRSDVAPYAAFAPNMGAELVTGNKTTLLCEVIGAYHSFGTNFIAVGVSPEFRYWFHGRPMDREFLGFSIIGATYKWSNYDRKEPMATPAEKRRTYKGNVGALALTFGYSWRLGQRERWNMEVRGGIGLYRYRQQSRYRWEGSQEPFTEKGLSILPYKVGLSFSYILPTENRPKKK